MNHSSILLPYSPLAAVALRFTDIIKKNPMHGFEPGKDWMLYKPLK